MTQVIFKNMKKNMLQKICLLLAVCGLSCMAACSGDGQDSQNSVSINSETGNSVVEESRESLEDSFEGSLENSAESVLESVFESEETSALESESEEDSLEESSIESVEDSAESMEESAEASSDDGKIELPEDKFE